MPADDGLPRYHRRPACSPTPARAGRLDNQILIVNGLNRGQRHHRKDGGDLWIDFLLQHLHGVALTGFAAKSNSTRLLPAIAAAAVCARWSRLAVPNRVGIAYT